MKSKQNSDGDFYGKDLIFYGDKEHGYYDDEPFYFYKHKLTDIIWYVRPGVHSLGPKLFSFDMKVIYNYWPDYPDNLTSE